MGKRAKTKEFGIHFPIGGLVKRYGYQSQPPYTTPDCQNVRPFDVLEGRERGGSRPGLVKAYDGALSDTPQCLAKVSLVDDGGDVTHTLIAVADNSFYKVTDGGLVALTNETLKTEDGDVITTEGSTAIDGGGTGASIGSGRVRATERGQKIYFADSAGTLVDGEDGTIANTNELTATAVSDWTAYGIDATRDVVLLTQRAGSSVEEGVYQITSVAAAKVTISATLTNGACNFQIAGGLKVFDPSTEEVAILEETDGFQPLACPLVCTYRDRICAAGPEHIWYMSRQGDPLDWDYGASVTDSQRAVAGTSADAGQIGQPITAMIPYSDDYIVFGCENSLWVLRGDPAYGGQLDMMSSQIGIINGDAWCSFPDASLLILSRAGLYLIPPGATGYPQEFSREIIPDELIDTDASSRITMVYDHKGRGVQLSIVPSDASTGTHWWIDISSGSIWPVTYSDDDMQPICGIVYAADTDSDQDLLLAGNDGYIRQSSEDASDDDGETIESYVVIGPLWIGAGMSRMGILTELYGVLDAQSNSVTCEIGVADYGEQTITQLAAPRFSTTLVGGRRNRFYPRVNAPAMAIRLSSTSQWAMESLGGVVLPGGRVR